MNNKEMKNLIKKARKLAKPFRVTDDSFRLKDIDPATPWNLHPRTSRAPRKRLHGR
jgi:hypothetical protein